MTRLELPEELVAAVDRHALSTYPEECCGVLGGRRTAGGSSEAARVFWVWPAPNVHPGPRTRRYAIAPEELLSAHKQARGRGEEVVGYYHSHPDRDAQPSSTDLAAAGPGVSYLIVAVQDGAVSERRSWRFRAGASRFEEEQVDVAASSVSAIGS